MTTRQALRVVAAVLIAALLGGTWAIVERYGSAASSAPAGFVH